MAWQSSILDGARRSSSNSPAAPRRFPPAAQPEIMRAAEKDEQYVAHVYEACRDAVRHLFGARVAITYQSEAKLLSQMLYYVLTTCSTQQTLGEEYCDIIQVQSLSRLPPTPARTALYIIYHTAIPYIADRLSSRLTAHGMMLASSHFEELSLTHGPGCNHSAVPVPAENVLFSRHWVILSALSRLKEKIHGLWLSGIRRWPLVLPFMQEIIHMALRLNLMFFYFEGLYFHFSKRAAGIQYVFVGKPLNQRPRYQILGIFLLLQIFVIGLGRLRGSGLSSVACSAQTAAVINILPGHGLPILNEDGEFYMDSYPSKDKAVERSIR